MTPAPTVGTSASESRNTTRPPSTGTSWSSVWPADDRRANPGGIVNDRLGDPSRREFLRLGAAAGLGAALPWTPERAEQQSLLFRGPPIPTVRIGFVGIGGQGSVHVENLLTLDGVEIKALCDIVPEKVTRWQEKVR